MSTTRHAQPGSELAPERGLSSPKISGINIGLNIVIKVAQAHDEPARRAMIWCVNYANNVARCTADALSHKLGLTKGQIRSALTDPESEDLDLFVDRVQRLRAEFEATITDLVRTEVNAEVSAAMKYALAKTKLVEIIGKTRMGKSECARVCGCATSTAASGSSAPRMIPSADSFLNSPPSSGIGVSSAKKTGLFRAQTKGCFGPHGITALVCDEAHRSGLPTSVPSPSGSSFSAPFTPTDAAARSSTSPPRSTRPASTSRSRRRAAGRPASTRAASPASTWRTPCPRGSRRRRPPLRSRGHRRRHPPARPAGPFHRGLLRRDGRDHRLRRERYGGVTIDAITKAQQKQARNTRLEMEARRLATGRGLRAVA